MCKESIGTYYKNANKLCHNVKESCHNDVVVWGRWQRAAFDVYTSENYIYMRSV